MVGWRLGSGLGCSPYQPHPLVWDAVTPLNSWAGMLAGVAEWLAAKKHPDKSDCPIPIGSKNCLPNTEPVRDPAGRDDLTAPYCWQG